MQLENEFNKYENIVKQGCIISPDIFNKYSEGILRELKFLPWFIIGAHQLKNISYADGRELTVDRDRKNRGTPTKAGKRKREERTKPQLKHERIYTFQQKENPSCNLQTGYTEIKQIKRNI